MRELAQVGVTADGLAGQGQPACLIMEHHSEAMQDNQLPSSAGTASGGWRAAGLFAVRYGIGGAMILAGVVVLMAVGGDLGMYGLASALGAGLSVLLLNLLYRIGVSGDRDREREEDARRYFDKHGLWPDDEEESRERAAEPVTRPDQAVSAELEERRSKATVGNRDRSTVSAPVSGSPGHRDADVRGASGRSRWRSEGGAAHSRRQRRGSTRHSGR